MRELRRHVCATFAFTVLYSIFAAVAAYVSHCTY